MIKNDLCYDLYDSDNGWGMGLEQKTKMMQMSALWQRLKEEDDDEDEEKEEERKKE